LLLLAAGISLCAGAQKAPKPPSPLVIGKTLAYTPDSLGNRIPDFSYCGYKASEALIPLVPARIVVPLIKDDATAQLQAAIDYVATLPVDSLGFRGAVLLQKGRYNVEGQLKIRATGIVLRGAGAGDEGTVLFGKGKDRETLIRILGHSDRLLMNHTSITDAYVPVNATKFTVARASYFKTGDAIVIHRSSSAAWIRQLGTDHFGGGETTLGWKPGERDVIFERSIKSINGNTIEIDVPLTTAIDTVAGGATVALQSWRGRIRNIGIENLSLVSDTDGSNPKDEDHRWMAITMENVEDAWVRQVSFKHFAGSAVMVLSSSRRVTVEDCISRQPVSEIGGQRRYTFFTSGAQTLFQRCYAENGYHDFATGFCAPGPNAFVQCQSVRPYSFSGAIDSWASGVLFDIVNVDGQALRFGDRGQDGQGAGWTAANSVFYQCSASLIECDKPPGANNYAFGSWAQFQGDGYWEFSNEQIQPRSLYYAQLKDRLGERTVEKAFIMPVETEASSSPSVEVAAALTRKAAEPLPTLFGWIEAAANRNPIPSVTTGIPTTESLGLKTSSPVAAVVPMQVQRGWLQRGGKIVNGRRQEVPWWNGGVLPNDLINTKLHLTRFVPGRVGEGLTDDIDSVVSKMKRTSLVAIEHNYGLWYERRRDDHERIRRMDGEVWPPFYELPFARSGKDTAWDGLSKYDLTKYNHWYWSRLKRFADLADRNNLVLVQQHYFQHNIIEAGAHYADFPWRTANNINSTGFPEPVPYAGDKRIFMAEQFYDLSDANRKKLHTAFIRKSLENFRGNSSVIHLTGAEFTGPLHFVQFWLDVVAAWEKEKGAHPVIGLSATKDVQDAILADARRAAAVDLIDIRYWHYQADGTAYAPKGGQNLAPRQHARLLKPKKTSFDQVYRAVSEYRLRYPAKAVMYSGDSYDQFGWAVLMGGGSMAVLPPLDASFLAAVTTTAPQKPSIDGMLELKGSSDLIIYSFQKGSVIPGEAYELQVIDPSNGKTVSTSEGSAKQPVVIAFEKPMVVWIHSKDRTLSYTTEKNSTRP